MRKLLVLFLLICVSSPLLAVDNFFDAVSLDTTKAIEPDIPRGSNLIDLFTAEGQITEFITAVDTGDAARDTLMTILWGPLKLDNWSNLHFTAFLDSVGAGDTLDHGDYDLDSLWTIATEGDTCRYVLQGSHNKVDWTDIRQGVDTVIVSHQTIARWGPIAPMDSLLGVAAQEGPWYRLIAYHNCAIGDFDPAGARQTMTVRHHFAIRGRK